MVTEMRVPCWLAGAGGVMLSAFLCRFHLTLCERICIFCIVATHLTKEAAMSEIRFLPVKLTPEEIQVIKNKVADLAVDMITWEVEMSSLKKKVSAAKEEQNVHALKLANGNEILDIECEWRMAPELKFNKGDNKDISDSSDEQWEEGVSGVKELIRLDTGERVEYEEMVPQDFQEQLSIDDEKKPVKKDKITPSRLKNDSS